MKTKKGEEEKQEKKRREREYLEAEGDSKAEKINGEEK